MSDDTTFDVVRWYDPELAKYVDGATAGEYCVSRDFEALRAKLPPEALPLEPGQKVEPVSALAPWPSVRVAVKPLVQVVLMVPEPVRSAETWVTIGSYWPNATPADASMVQLAETSADTGKLEGAGRLLHDLGFCLRLFIGHIAKYLLEQEADLVKRLDAQLDAQE